MRFSYLLAASALARRRPRPRAAGSLQLRHHLRSRRAQHWLRRDERPHLRARGAQREPNGKTTIFVGAASGGVWKSEDGGTRYKPVFDDQPVQSIGAVALDPKNPKNVWVGTGESWTRNSVSIGNGIYRSTDGGEHGRTWVCRTRSASRRSSSARRTATRFTRRCRARCGATRQSAVSTRRPTAARPGTTILKGAQSLDRLLDHRDGSEQSERHLRGHVGFPPQRLDLPLRRRRS